MHVSSGESSAAEAVPARPAPVAVPAFRGVTGLTRRTAPTIIDPTVLQAPESHRSDEYYVTKSMIFGALIEAIDLSQLARLDAESAREEIRDIVNEIIAIKNIVMSISEQETCSTTSATTCSDTARSSRCSRATKSPISWSMVRLQTYIEVGGKIQLTNIRFRDNAQLMNICQRIVSQVGRRVDEASPICDARLADGSRVNVIAPPLAIDGPVLTIRKFRKDKLTLDQLIRLGCISPEGGEILKIIGRVRCNVLISGGTGSGKTTLLNCLTHYIDGGERVITCEDAAELQLQQPHVVRLETTPAQSRRHRRRDYARSGAQLPAHASRAHHRRRGSRTRSLRPPAGHEHRP